MSKKNLFSMGSLGNSMDFFEDVRVVVVGDHKVGKSSLIHRNIHNKFNENYYKTSSIEKHNWTHVVSNRDVYYTIWDTPGGGKSHKWYISIYIFCTCCNLYKLQPKYDMKSLNS
uniref:Uncharacterized protein n=1 Tax=Lepeophtheirus salmonis TaxID=72036 RepID=A0A0K2UXI0_LEPSM